MMDEGVRRLAASVLVQAAKDAAGIGKGGLKPEAWAFLRGMDRYAGDLEFWCALAGMDPEAVIRATESGPKLRIKLDKAGRRAEKKAALLAD